jgi:signal transduction histidine kinase
MSRPDTADRITTRDHRGVRLLGFVLIFGAALRRLAELDEWFSIGAASLIFGLFTVLYLAEPRLSQRWAWFPRAYFAVQFLLAQALGGFGSFQDSWVLLYVVLGFQTACRFPRREALAWDGLFTASALVTLTAEFGLLSGPGRAMAYLVIGLIIILFDSQYARQEDAREESRLLVAELRQAHQTLRDSADRAEEQAAERERERILRELHDSVGQKVFAIQLAAETSLLLLEKDPQRIAGQLDLLQDQTQAALTQMRQLIEQWNPR